MKSYPSIDGKIRFGEKVYAFDKLDGSNVRAEWSKKNGFYKFGRRNGLLDDSSPILKRAPALIEAKYGDILAEVFRKERYQKVVAFFEFCGPSSFAGWHDENEALDVHLIDASVDNRGILAPDEYMKVFKYVPKAELLYQGTWNQTMTDQVKNGTLPGMTFEGVVCKGAYDSPGLPLMFKVKNLAWVQKLRERCQGNDALFNQLA